MQYGSSLAFACALLLASACVTGVDVGHDGHGGSASTTAVTGSGGNGGGSHVTSSTGSTGTGGAMPAGNACTSPGALLCNWGWIGGPCGGGQDCTNGWVCVGSSPGVPGTCANPTQALVGAGSACGAGVSGTPTCPWNYVCNAPIAPDGVGTCVPGNCVLEAPTPFVSAASITVDGDGPTQHDDFACTAPYWGSQVTGEANGYVTALAPSGGLAIIGCTSTHGDVGQGSIILTVPLSGAGTVHTGQVEYYPPPALGDMSGNYDRGLDPLAPMTVTVTEMSAGQVSGSFDVVLQNGNFTMDMKHLTGTFEVCRLPSRATDDW